MLHHHLTYIDVGAIFLAKPVDHQTTEKDKGNMRFVYLVLVAITVVISCGFYGCDFITGKSPESTHADVTIETDSDWGPLFSMPELTSLSLHINRRFASIDDLAPLSELRNLISLSLYYRGDNLDDIASIASLTNLTSLELHVHAATIHEPPFDLSMLASLTNLKSLSLETYDAVNFEAVSSLVNLTSLSLKIRDYTDISSITSLENLSSFEFTNTGSLNKQNTEAIGSLINLQSLKLNGNLTDISPLLNLTKLISLDLSHNTIKDLTPISYFRNLVELNLEDNNIIDITPLSSLNKLTSLNLQGNKINDILPLSTLSNLTHLLVSWNEIVDIAPLASLQNLTTLWLGANQISSISELKSLPKLKELLLDGNPLNDNSVNEIITELLAQEVEVYWWDATEYAWLITLILTQELDEGEYHIYSPDMSFGIMGGQAASTSFGGGEEYLIESFRDQGVEVGKLFEVLFERNQVPERMQIPSSLKDGYIIDYDGYFVSYFENDPEMNGWQRLRNENPGAHAFVTISVPAYDLETGIVLVYIGWQGDWLLGEGRIYAFKYNGIRLMEIASIGLWIS